MFLHVVVAMTTMALVVMNLVIMRTMLIIMIVMTGRGNVDLGAAVTASLSADSRVCGKIKVLTLVDTI